MSYVFSSFFGVVSFSTDQRATMDCLDSTLARPNSRISSTSLAMTRASHRSLHHAAAAPIVCYRIWDVSAIVSLIHAFLTSHVCVTDEFVAFLLFYLYLLRSQLYRSPHERDKLCYPGSLVTDDRRLGGLWDVEVRRSRSFQAGRMDTSSPKTGQIS